MTANVSQTGTTVKEVISKTVLLSTKAAGGHLSLHLAPFTLIITESVEKSMVNITEKHPKP